MPVFVEDNIEVAGVYRNIAVTVRGSEQLLFEPRKRRKQECGQTRLALRLIHTVAERQTYDIQHRRGSDKPDNRLFAYVLVFHKVDRAHDKTHRSKQKCLGFREYRYREHRQSILPGAVHAE